MSDYPIVYGRCAAGCKRRVPSYQEFEQSAPMFKVESQSNRGDVVWYLEEGKKYKIRSTSSDSLNGLNINILCKSPSGETKVWKPTLPSQPFMNEITFKYVGFKDDTLYVYINDELQTYGGVSGLSPVSNAINVSGAKDVYAINDGEFFLNVKPLYIHSLQYAIYSASASGNEDETKPYLYYEHTYLSHNDVCKEGTANDLLDILGNLSYVNLSNNSYIRLANEQSERYVRSVASVPSFGGGTLPTLMVSYLGNNGVLDNILFDFNSENYVVDCTTSSAVVTD